MTQRCLPCIFPQHLNPDGTGIRKEDTGALAYYTKNKDKLVKIPLTQETKIGNCKHTQVIGVHSPFKQPSTDKDLLKSDNKRADYNRKKYQSVVQKGNGVSLRKSGAPEIDEVLRSDPDISKYETYQRLDDDGFKLKAIQLDGPLGKLLEDI